MKMVCKSLLIQLLLFTIWFLSILKHITITLPSLEIILHKNDRTKGKNKQTNKPTAN